MYPPVKNFTPREIYACGGGLIVAPTNPAHLEMTPPGDNSPPEITPDLRVLVSLKIRNMG